MADLPVERPDPNASVPVAAGAPLDSNFLMGFARLPVVRQLVLLVSLAASVAVGVTVVMWMRDPDYRVLDGIDSIAQKSMVRDILDTNNIEYHIDPTSGMLMVPRESLHEALMIIAAAGGISIGSQKGCEILFEEQGFGTSQLVEKAQLSRCLEGELEKSIETINIVQSARVHLAIPKPSVFIKDHPTPTATVTLVLMGGPQSMSGDQVRAVMSLVAGAVPELETDKVTVVDQNGTRLSHAAQDPSRERSQFQLQYIRDIEASKKAKIANLLQPIVGTNQFRAEVNVEVDFTAVEETAETFNSDLPATRSELLKEERRGGADVAQGTPGALSNRPPGTGQVPETADAAVSIGGSGAPGAAEGRIQFESQKNYELDRSISHTRHSSGAITRLTVSVVVADLMEVDPDSGEVTYIDREEAEIERLTGMVKDAIGFNPARGDKVSLIPAPFIHVPVELSEPVPFWMMPWFIDIVKQVLGGLALLILVMGLLRPLIRNVKEVGAEVMASRALAANAAAASLSGPDSAAQLSAQAGALSAPRFGPKMEEVQGLIAEDPARVAQVVKRWATSDE